LGRKLLDLAKLFVSEDLVNSLIEFDKKFPGLFSPTFQEEATEALQTNSNWLQHQGVGLCKWVTEPFGN
jgi:hypothetical protein